MTENVDIIVSRYNEDLQWTLEYPFNQFKYTVYNKGINDNFIKENVKKIINLDNVGKCDHTYLYHIITNYNNLSNIIVFFPGSLDMDYKKQKAVKLLNLIIQNNFNKAYFIGDYQNNLCESFKNFKLDNWTTTNERNATINSETALQKCRLRPYGVWYRYFFGRTKAHWVSMWGIFSVDKRDILQHKKNRYVVLIQTINKHSNPEAGHYIERSWCAIFYPLVHTIKTS
jgi:hypothetical protein